MSAYGRTFFEISALPAVAGLIAETRPAWVWSADGHRILWANAAGARFFRESSMAALLARTLADTAPARRHLERLSQGPAERETLERLRFFIGARAVQLTALARALDLSDGTRAALVVSGDTRIEMADPVQEFCALLADNDVSALLISADGAVVSAAGVLADEARTTDLALEGVDGQGDIRLRLGTGAHAAEVADLGAAAPAARLVIAQNTALPPSLTVREEAAAEPETSEIETPEPAAAQPAADVAADNASLPAENEAGAQVADEEDGRTVATSSFPRTFFPWNRFLKTHEREDAGSEAAADAAAQPAKDELSENVAGEVSGETSDEVPQAAPAVIAETIREAEPAPRMMSPALIERLAQSEEDLIAEARAARQMLMAQDEGPQAARDSDEQPRESVDPGRQATVDDEAGRAAAEPAAEAEPEADVFKVGEAPSTPAFEFDNDGRPVRFVWQMNVDRVFTGVSPELAQVIGPEAADIVGHTWEEVAERLDLDPNGRVASALSRRDTWSGVTVEWPVTDNPLAVPVDLAALPAFDRFRQFEGYRGFGVCRPADAVSMERMNPAAVAEKPAAPAEDLAAPAEELTAPAEEPAVLVEERDETAPESTTPEPTASTRSEAIARAAAAAATIFGAGLLAREATPEEAAAEAVPQQGESPADETGPQDVATAVAEDAADETGDAVPQTMPEPEPEPEPEPGSVSEPEPEPERDSPASATVTQMPAPAQPAPAYGLYHDASGSSPSWGLPEAANSQEAIPATAEDGAHAEDSPAADDSADEAVAAHDGAAEARADDAPAEAEIAVAEQPVLASPVVIVEPDASTDLAPSPEVETPAPEDTSEVEPVQADLEGPVDLEGPADESDAAPEDNGPETPFTELVTEPVAEPVEDMQAEAVPLAETTETPTADEATEEEPAVPSEAEPFLPMGDLPSSPRAEDAPDLGPEPDAVSDLESEATTEPEAAAEPEALPEPVAQADGEAGDESFAETVVRLAERQVIPPDSQLTRPEREAFRKIAEALGARIEETNRPADEAEGEAVPPIPMPIAPRPKPRAPEETREAEAVKAAEQAVMAIHPRLLDRLPIGVAIVRDRDVEYANRSLLKMLGYADLEALAEAGGLEAVFVRPEAWPPEPAGSATIERSLCIRSTDGVLHPVDAFMHTVPWKSGSGLMISLREKREQPSEEVAAALEQAKERISELEAILETATDGVIVLDAEGRILSVNRSAEALFNASRQMMTGAALTDYLALESHRSALDYLDGLARNGVASVLNDGREVIGQIAGGGLIPLFMTIGRVGRHGAREDAKFCAVLRDITQWKKAEEELTTAKRQAENASSQKSDFLAKISHEIRTPLNAIIGFSEVMMDERFGAVGNERYKDYLKDIHASGSHLLSLINDLLDLSKVEAGKFELAFEAVPINEVLRDCVALMQPQANRDRVIIRASLPTSVPKVVADPRSVRQIVLNLLSNAIKFNQAGGQVIVSTALEPTGEVVLRVRDTGMGMSRKDIEAALEPFRQLHTARLGGGTGLGLPLTKALVEANRAGFSIDSEPNQGTLVEITFPSQRVLAE
ncbi:ATP-binding protein [Breoghania sp. JC706]|uniref:ATP-binding protein n=1 Tax=Breoghania sp. JC706 TaxID=3117732 RepID=UPI00300B4173